MACSTFDKTTNMNHLGFFLILSISLFSCNKSSSDQETAKDENAQENPNQALYDEVMNVHDEVMPKMDDIYQLKRKLQDSIANSTDLVIEQKQKIEKRIAELDSASDAMMNWMHKFNPLPDSADQEEAREYLESEMEKIKKVRDAMLEAIDRAKQDQ